MKFIKFSLFALLGLIGILVLLSLYFGATEPSIDDFRGENSVQKAAQPGGVSVRFAGNANLLISDGETNLMIDGWFSRPSVGDMLSGEIAPDLPVIEASLTRLGVAELAAVIPVHSHYDHAMDAPEVARRTGAMLVGSPSTRNIGLGWGLEDDRVIVAEHGTPMSFGAFSVTLLKSKHYAFTGFMKRLVDEGGTIDAPLTPPVKADAYRQGEAYSVLIEHPAGSLLIQGSAGFVEGQLAPYDVDVVLMGVGGIAGQTTEYGDTYWRETVTATTPSLVVPIHYDSLTAPLGDEPATTGGLFGKLLGGGSYDNIDYVFRRAEAAGIGFLLPPMWEEVPLLPVGD